LPRSEVGMVIS